MTTKLNYTNKFLQFQGEKNPSTFCFLGDARTKSIVKSMTSHLDALVRPAVYSPVSPKCPHKVKLHNTCVGRGNYPGWIWTEGREKG